MIRTLKSSFHNVVLLSGLTCLALISASPLRAEAPQNIQVRVLPAEVFLTWDALPGAVRYRVDRGGIDRRWVPLPETSEPRFRDTDYLGLPSYYVITSFDAAGEASTSAEFLVSPALKNSSLDGHVIRQVSDSAVVVSWRIAGNPADGILEIGEGTNSAVFFALNTNLLYQHEFLVTSLLPNHEYWFRLTSTDAGRGGFTYRNTFVKPFYTPPAPLALFFDESTTQVQFDTDEDKSVPLYLTGGTVDGPFSFEVPSQPFAGALLGTAPQLEYVPAVRSANTVDFFRVEAFDSITRYQRYVNILIRPGNHPPIANDQSITIPEDTAVRFQTTAYDFWDPIAAYSIVVGPTNGTLVDHEFPSSPLFDYYPKPNFNGVDHIFFTASDGQTTGNVATVKISVTPVPDPPQVSNETFTVDRNVPTVFTVDATDPDERDILTFSVVSLPRWGNLSGPNFQRQFTYTPLPHITNDLDSFTYSVSDALFTRTATVTLQITPPYVFPIANSITATTDANQPVVITLSGSSMENVPLTYQILTYPSHGGLSGIVPQLLYTPIAGYTGPDSFTYRVMDGRGASAPATVGITVFAAVPPDPPTGLVATPVSASRIDLSWSDNSWNEANFEIERSNDNKAWKLVATVGRDIRVFANTGLTGNKTYSYRVRATNPYGNSGYSEIATAKTLR